MIYVILSVQVLIILLGLLCIFWFVELLVSRHGPFVWTPQNVLSSVIKEMNLTDDSVVYDLGCGDGRVLVGCREQNRKAVLRGVERAFIPYYLAKLNLRARKIRDITLKRGNLFDGNYSDATHIFIWLTPHYMEKLYPKFVSELQPGTLVVSHSFVFKDKKPEKVLEFPEQRSTFGKKFNLYRF